jgi:hypothetical protein
MTDRIRELLRAKDWRPFTVRRVGGESIHVGNRETAWISPYGRFVFERQVGQIEVLGPDQIAGIDVGSLNFSEIQNQTG